MGKIEELQEQVNVLTALLAKAGLLPKAQSTSEHAPDYVAHGSAKHAAMIGLAEVTDIEQAKKAGYIMYTGKSGKTWRLEDEIGATRFYPGVDPTKAMLMTLRQKVAVIEAGAPPIPQDAPPMYVGEVA